MVDYVWPYVPSRNQGVLSPDSGCKVVVDLLVFNSLTSLGDYRVILLASAFPREGSNTRVGGWGRNCLVQASLRYSSILFFPKQWDFLTATPFHLPPPFLPSSPAVPFSCWCICCSASVLFVSDSVRFSCLFPYLCSLGGGISAMRVFCMQFGENCAVWSRWATP